MFIPGISRCFLLRSVLPPLFLIACLSCNLIWTLSASPLLQESTPRIVLSCLTFFLFPGLIIGELFRFRSRHFLHMLAYGMLFTLALVLILLPIVFLVQAKIAVFSLAVIGLSLGGAAVVLIRALQGQPLSFLRPLSTLPAGNWQTKIAYLVVCLIPIILSILMYRTGESHTDIGGEKLLHLVFVRNYYSMPLNLNDLGIEANFPPPNLVNLWEFLIAASARAGQIDPLPMFYRARFLLPLFGLAGMYLLVHVIFRGFRRRQAVFLAIALMCGLRLFLATPGLSWVSDTDSTRGVFAFTGTAHHADVAMDLLLAVSIAIALQTLLRFSIRNLSLFVLILIINFLSHPREFFQIALYMGIAGLMVIAIPAIRRVVHLRPWLVSIGTMFVVAVVLMGLSMTLTKPDKESYDEMTLKKTSLQYAIQEENLKDARSFFHFPNHFELAHSLNPKEILSIQEMRQTQLKNIHQPYSWILFSGLALIVLCWLGNSRDKVLAGYVGLLWYLTLCWTTSMFLLLVLTYSEFFMSTPRLIYIFSYLVIARALVLIVARLQLIPSIVPSALATLIVGYITAQWYLTDTPHSMKWTTAISWLMILSLSSLLFRRASFDFVVRERAWSWLGVIIFFAPYVWQRASEESFQTAYSAREELNWFADDNPFGMSSKLITWTRSLPAKQTILVHPGGIEDPQNMDCLSVYAPQYSAILPVPLIHKTLAEREQIKNGEHPLLFPISQEQEKQFVSLKNVNHQRAKKWIQQRGINYVVIDREYYRMGLQDYFLGHPESYRVVFHHPEAQEMVVQCK